MSSHASTSDADARVSGGVAGLAAHACRSTMMQAITWRLDPRVCMRVSPGAIDAEDGGMRGDRSSRGLTTHSFTFRNRSAFAMTENELRLIATAATVGPNTMPKIG